MKRKPRILIVLLSVITTFGILFATVGKPNYMKHKSPFGNCEKMQNK